MANRACHDCVYCGRPPATRVMRDFTAGWPSLLMCVNHPDSPGTVVEVAPNAAACRSFRARPLPPVRVTPPEPPNDLVRYIALTKGKWAIVDAADYEWLSQYRWHARECRGRCYAATVINGKAVTMHHMIMQPPPGKVTDHIDANGLDNRRANMRNCDPDENRRHTRPRPNTTNYIGVYQRGEKYVVKISHKGVHYYYGPFDTALEAAKFRDQKAKELFGKFAWLNFPEDQEEKPETAD